MKNDKYQKKCQVAGSSNRFKNSTIKLNSKQQISKHSTAKKTTKKVNKKPMTEKRKKNINKFNTLFLIVYAIFSIYVIMSYLNWRSLALPMMKNECSMVIDVKGNTVETVGSERKCSNVELSQIPDNLKNAYIDIEDERFYSHRGVDIKRTVAAIGSYIIHFGKSSFGGSTITQQLVKNLTGDDDTSISRKMGEWIRASELETFCNKDEILQSYFNIIYVAPNTYGVDAGSKYYFDKSVTDLDLAECAFLAGINNAPNSYNPFSEKDNSERIKKRSKTVLSKMLELNHIKQEEYDTAVNEIDSGLAFKNGNIETSNGIYSYHTDALISELVSDLSNKKHIDVKFATNYIYMSGSKIYSTEDADIQKIVEEEYKKSQYAIKSSTTGNTSQSAMVVIDHKNGQVVACVGGLGDKKTSRGFNRATQAYRQTGSASKPLVLLIPGINEKLFTASTIYNDEPTRFEDGTDDGYNPTDNDDYIGEITVRRAVESSQNIPFVKMLEQITPKKAIKYLDKMGITSIQDEDETLMLALGGLKKGITPLEMAGAYATIANDGTYIEPTFYTKLESRDGKTVIKTSQKKREVFSEEVACIIKQLLKQPVEGNNGTAKYCKIDGMDVAAKTGTTNNNYDKWLCGFTTYYTAVTWYGYDLNEPVTYKGKSPAVMLWSSTMKKVHSELPKTKFNISGEVKQATICPKSGKTATSNCSNTYTEYFLSGTIPDQCTTCSSSTKKTDSVNNKTTNIKTNTTTNKNQVTNKKTNTNAKNNTSNNISTNTNNTTNNKLQDNGQLRTENEQNNNINNNQELVNNTIQNQNNVIDEDRQDGDIDDEEDDGP